MASTSTASSASGVASALKTPPSTKGSCALLIGGKQATRLRERTEKMSAEDRILFLAGTGSASQVNQLISSAKDALGGDVSMKSHKGGNSLLGKNAEPGMSSSDLTFDGQDLDSENLRPDTALNIFANAGLRPLMTLSLTTPSASNTPASSTLSPLHLYILHRAPFVFPPISSLEPSTLNPTAHPFGIPTAAEFKEVWKAWDTVTLGMIPKSMLHEKPIDLRHKCLFYMGHLPTFLDMLLSNLLKERNTEPLKFTQIFERGIDPHVDDPDHCHRHSEVPTRDEDWPDLSEILDFRDRVRARLLRLLENIESGKRPMTRRIARTLIMILEHDAWHIETLLYMLIQRAGTGTLPPPGFPTPPFSLLASQWNSIYSQPSRGLTVTIGTTELVMGHDDAESDDLKVELEKDVFGRSYGWDNESPAKVVTVDRFKIDWRPITNEEYFTWWSTDKENTDTKMPPSWVMEGDEVKVRTFHGNVGMDVARHWPVLTSYDDLAAYAESKGGRIPREKELRLFFDRFEVGYEGGANVGFRNWHPVPATTGDEANGGRGSNGGVWEWTSDVLDTHEGFVPTTIFPGYSEDFFDGKHQVVIGASYATIPRLAQRRTVRNFYQHNYPYPWVGARVAYDV